MVNPKKEIILNSCFTASTNIVQWIKKRNIINHHHLSSKTKKMCFSLTIPPNVTIFILHLHLMEYTAIVFLLKLIENRKGKFLYQFFFLINIKSISKMCKIFFWWHSSMYKRQTEFIHFFFLRQLSTKQFQSRPSFEFFYQFQFSLSITKSSLLS